MNKSWGIVALVVAALYWLQAVLIPVALAVLLTFLLSPVVGILQRRRLGRVPAGLVTVLLAFSILGGVGWALTHQLITLANELPRYSLNIHQRIADLRGASRGGSVEKVQKALEDVVGEIQKTGKEGVTGSQWVAAAPGAPVDPCSLATPPPSAGERGARDGARDLHAARAPGAPRSADLADWLSAGGRGGPGAPPNTGRTHP